MILPRIKDVDADTRAELMLRLASAFDGLERPDDAYQTLIGADRLHRGNLLVKLALGEYRYRARRWREAALHLSALADREDAHRHPSSVAHGLYHAALAEIRSLRPEKAEPLYRAALDLKGNYGPALRALAEVELERGNTEEACELLTKQAVATESPKERLRLFEALGDMCMQELHDEQRARVCYEAALRAAEPLDSEHMPLLQKLLARQVAAGERADCGCTCELLASFAQDAKGRCERHIEAAQHFIDAELPEETRSAADRAVGADAYDLVACDMASELAMKARDHEAAAAMLGPLLNHREGTDSDPNANDLALLWTRLGDARRERGDNKSAETCFEKTLEVSPQSSGAMSARRTLLALWEGRPGKANTMRNFRKNSDIQLAERR
ncbi:MAG: tetratricopeptide repeat protein [Myxococcales bacterium]|nr:tetratricopeptide repeat protein [Myxococcales bacterium]